MSCASEHSARARENVNTIKLFFEAKCGYVEKVDRRSATPPGPTACELLKSAIVKFRGNNHLKEAVEFMDRFVVAEAQNNREPSKRYCIGVEAPSVVCFSVDAFLDGVAAAVRTLVEAEWQRRNPQKVDDKRYANRQVRRILNKTVIQRVEDADFVEAGPAVQCLCGSAFASNLNSCPVCGDKRRRFSARAHAPCMEEELREPTANQQMAPEYPLVVVKNTFIHFKLIDTEVAPRASSAPPPARSVDEHCLRRRHTIG
jgi:hypothetical protein